MPGAGALRVEQRVSNVSSQISSLIGRTHHQGRADRLGKLGKMPASKAQRVHNAVGRGMHLCDDSLVGTRLGWFIPKVNWEKWTSGHAAHASKQAWVHASCQLACVHITCKCC